MCGSNYLHSPQTKVLHSCKSYNCWLFFESTNESLFIRESRWKKEKFNSIDCHGQDHVIESAFGLLVQRFCILQICSPKIFARPSRFQLFLDPDRQFLGVTTDKSRREPEMYEKVPSKMNFDGNGRDMWE